MNYVKNAVHLSEKCSCTERNEPREMKWDIVFCLSRSEVQQLLEIQSSDLMEPSEIGNLQRKRVIGE